MSSMHVRGSSFRELHDLPEITAQVRHLGGRQALYSAVAASGRRTFRKGKNQTQRFAEVTQAENRELENHHESLCKV
jgi:hypothetical protein